MTLRLVCIQLAGEDSGRRVVSFKLVLEVFQLKLSGPSVGIEKPERQVNYKCKQNPYLS